MKQGFSVIVDGTCNFSEVLDQGSALVRQYGYSYWYVGRRLRAREPMTSQRAAVDQPSFAAAAAATQRSRDGPGPCLEADCWLAGGGALAARQLFTHTFNLTQSSFGV